jgi:HEPN domain-containing protein
MCWLLGRVSVRREVLLWLAQAEGELRKIMNDLRTEDWDSAAFWSQQAAEKSLKPLLISGGKIYGGHELLEMARVLEKELGLDPENIRDDLRELTIHYTISRYPNAANAIPQDLYTKDKAEELVQKAKRVLEWVRQNLQ